MTIYVEDPAGDGFALTNDVLRNGDYFNWDRSLSLEENLSLLPTSLGEDVLEKVRRLSAAYLEARTAATMTMTPHDVLYPRNYADQEGADGPQVVPTPPTSAGLDPAMYRATINPGRWIASTLDEAVSMMNRDHRLGYATWEVDAHGYMTAVTPDPNLPLRERMYVNRFLAARDFRLLSPDVAPFMVGGNYLPVTLTDEGLVGAPGDSLDSGGVELHWAPVHWTSNRPPSRAALPTAAQEWYREYRTQRLPGARVDWNIGAEERRRRDEATARYGRYRSAIPRTSEQLVDTLPGLPTGAGASRRWGIEVESGAASGIEAPPGWDRRDDGSLVSAYGRDYIEPSECEEYADDHEEEIEVTRTDNGDTLYVQNPNYVDPDYCDYCGDREDYYDDENCAEFVSPILTSWNSRGLREILEGHEGRPTTSSAGVHVHVEAKDLTAFQIGQLLLAYDRIEPLLEASYEREERGYCKLRSGSELLEIVRHTRSNPRGDLASGMPHGDRYVTLNLNSLYSHGTVEFRAMGPVYNYHRLTRWAMFCREMVNTVANGATAKEWGKVKDWYGVLDMFRKYGVELSRAELRAEFDQANDALVNA